MTLRPVSILFTLFNRFIGKQNSKNEPISKALLVVVGLCEGKPGVYSTIWCLSSDKQAKEEGKCYGSVKNGFDSATLVNEDTKDGLAPSAHPVP